MRKKLCENEYRVFGIPGAGKTTYLSEKIQGAVEKGYNNMIISSFTRTAARELAGRDLPINDKQIGTLHSHCFNALGAPTIAESKINEFNEQYKDFVLSKKTDNNMDESHLEQQEITNENDKLFSQYQINRNKKLPREYWNPSVISIANAWEEFKNETGYFDFTDLIETAKDTLLYPPFNANVGMFDEVQDFTPLQMDLIRQWAKQMNYTMICGDDDQAIQTFAGADPHTFLEPEIDPSRMVILGQSYRVPRAVQALASRIISNVEKRQPKEQTPRNSEGEVNYLYSNYKNASILIPDIQEELKQENENKKPKSVMFLTTCSYMLNNILSALKDKGIPFHNPYRRKRGDWNPIKGGSNSTVSKMLGFLEPKGPQFGQYTLWDSAQLYGWISLIKTTGILQKGGKQKVKDFLDNAEHYSDEDLLDLYTEVFTPEALEQAAQLDRKWLRENATKEKYKSMEFPTVVMDNSGQQALKETPRLIVGTIHSVKGGQADTVYLAPDLSMNAHTKYCRQRSEEYEAVIRQMYVGVTRAREKLNILSPVVNGRMAAEIM